MAGAWGIALLVFFPIPLILLVLLQAPFASVRVFAARACKNLLGVRVIGGFSVLFVAVACSLALVAATTFDSMAKSAALKSLSPKADFQLRLTTSGKKWRAERNFWLSFLALVLWVMLRQFAVLTARVEQLEAAEKDQRDAAAKSKKKD